jgi:hypothetical protein
VRLLDHRDVSAPNLFDVKIIVKRCAPASVITIIIGHPAKLKTGRVRPPLPEGRHMSQLSPITRIVRHATAAAVPLSNSIS